MIAVGKHKGRCIGHALVQFGKAGNGNPQIAVPMEVLEGDSKGERGWFLASLGSDEAAAFAFKSLRAMGWKSDDICDLRGLEDNVVVMTVEEEEWQGKKRNRIKYVDTADRRFEFNNTLSDQDKMALSIKLKAHAVQSRIEAGKILAKPAAPAPAASAGAPAAAGVAPLEELPF